MRGKTYQAYHKLTPNPLSVKRKLSKISLMRAGPWTPFSSVTQRRDFPRGAFGPALLYTAIVSGLYASGDRFVRTPLNRLALTCRMSTRSAKRHLGALVKRGFVGCGRKGYNLLDPRTGEVLTKGELMARWKWTPCPLVLLYSCTLTRGEKRAWLTVSLEANRSGRVPAAARMTHARIAQLAGVSVCTVKEDLRGCINKGVLLSRRGQRASVFWIFPGEWTKTSYQTLDNNKVSLNEIPNKSTASTSSSWKPRNRLEAEVVPFLQSLFPQKPWLIAWLLRESGTERVFYAMTELNDRKYPARNPQGLTVHLVKNVSVATAISRVRERHSGSYRYERYGERDGYIDPWGPINVLRSACDTKRALRAQPQVSLKDWLEGQPDKESILKNIWFRIPAGLDSEAAAAKVYQMLRQVRQRRGTPLSTNLSVVC